MSRRQACVAVIGGLAVGVVVVVLGEVGIGIAGRQVLRWMAAGVPLIGWRHIFLGMSNFFARYFAIMSPLILVLSVTVALLVARSLLRHAAA